MSYLKFVVFVFTVVQIHHSRGQIGCTFSYKTDLADKEPVLLTSDKSGYNLFEPTTPELKIKKNDEVTIACAGGNNKLNGVNKEIATAKCVGVKTIAIDGKQMELNKISCDKKATGSYLNTNEPCGKQGFKKYIGHKIGEKFYPRFHVCYDHKNGRTLYSKHILQGASIDHDKQGKQESNFKVGGLEFRVKPEVIYNPGNLKKIFTTLLDSRQAADQYINTKSTLIPGQLSPKSDFVLSTSQYAPYYYINTIPQWQSISSGNWKTLEENIRKVASGLKDDFKIITGTHEVLTLKNNNNQETKIYLDEQQTLPVPKFVWKIVYSPKLKRAIAFVNLNNPFVKSVPSGDLLCNDVCDKNGWANSLWKQSDKGLIFCCDAKQLIEKVKTVPSFGEISGILDGKVTYFIPKPVITPATPSGCIMDYKTDFPEKSPILLKGGQNYDYEIANLEESLILSTYEEISLYCSGSSNKINKLNKNIVQAKCVSETTLKIEGKNYNFKDLGCSNKVNTEYKLTRSECVNNGLLKKIGHKHEKNFINIIDVCYDHKQGIPLYSQHILRGEAINNAKIVEQNIDYKVAGLDFRVQAEEVYKTDSQKRFLETILESKQEASKYSSYLARAHLSPAADFVFATSKSSSNFFTNTVPQWQTINNGNWKSLENAIRMTASSLGKPFEIITGGYGVLSLKTAKGKEIEVYLDVLKTLPVPKFIYKIMYSPETKKGIAFVSLNNPYVSSINPNDYICPNVCKNYGWEHPDWDKKEKGLIYCCEIKELTKVVDTVPEIGAVQSVQEFKKK